MNDVFSRSRQVLLVILSYWQNIVTVVVYIHTILFCLCCMFGPTPHMNKNKINDLLFEKAACQDNGAFKLCWHYELDNTRNFLSFLRLLLCLDNWFQTPTCKYQAVWNYNSFSTLKLMSSNFQYYFGFVLTNWENSRAWGYYKIYTKSVVAFCCHFAWQPQNNCNGD